MPRVPRRYAIHLMLSGGQQQMVHFANLNDFQTWYGSVLTTAAPEAFVNVPISDMDSEYLVVRAGSVIGLRIEPEYASGELDFDG